MPSALALTALMLAPLPANEPPVLDAIFAFDDPARCVPAPVFRQIIDGWAVPKSGRGWTLGELVLPPGYEDVIAYHRQKVRGQPGRQLKPMILEMWGNNGRHDVIAFVQGRWHGLPVHHISVWDGPPASGTMIDISFEAKADRVAPVLSGLGFPPADSWTHRGEDGVDQAYAKLSCHIQ